MRVLVTGAAGFIGWNLTRLLLVRGHTVIALVHKEADAVKFGKAGRTVVGDVRRRETCDSAAKDADAIVHLALPPADVKLRDAVPIWREGTANLLAVAGERGARSFVLGSGAGGMYRHEPGAWVTEATPELPFTAPTRVRAEVDEMARAAYRDHGLQTAVLRPNLVYGRGGPFQKYFLELMRRGKYRVVGDGSNYLAMVHVQDCAKAYALAAEGAPAGETFLIADDTPMTLRGLTDAIADALRVRRPGHAPPILASLVVGRDAVAILTESMRIRNARLKERFGWSPAFASLRDGLPSVVA